MERTNGARATLDAVATAAGVSKATVSKVLNGRPGVSEETRARVRGTLRAVGYTPTTGPRDPAPAGAVQLVFDALVNPYSVYVLDGVLAGARDLGVEVVTSVLQPGEDAQPAELGVDEIERLGAKGRAGLVIVTSQLTAQEIAACRRLDIGLVAVDPVNPLDESVVSVGATNWAGGVQATEHLLSLGHRRIAYAGGPQRSVPARERLHGYREALEAAGLDADPALTLHDAFRADAGARMAATLLGREDPPTAIFAGSDAIAMGVLQAARAHGLDLPGDLSVVGFDDTYGALWTDPPLTTVHQPLRDMGRVAARTVLQLARREPPDSHHVQLATRLVIRDSTAPPRPRATT
ncbi:LacI family DNA-binding transcriptional regulator [Streptomyces sp. N2-109]|uniref:LacI family DNA-binding transcriptional regulator n=1 Tax=Streptomyces gossypii TaxID=2883101 RepID=A0ABT2JV02_9ACTN|nr:LacI family DNA-binding transcriptional regulator [Streptomyces gossypii]MCT2591722.1 LacI family DNA-binding transcriptional regulator [Streptomyces gossypii]